jgi:AraC-like DNA-binding protein
MAAKLTGAVYSFDTHFLYVGPLIASARHKHHAGQIIWAPGGLDVEDENRARSRVTAHLIPPDTFHSHGATAAAAVLWVDRDDLPWDRAVNNRQEVCSAFAPGVHAQIDERVSPADARVLARALLAMVAPADRSAALAPRHPAVKRMCELLDTNASEREISVTELARQSGLSMRQLRHRFTEDLGINPQSYLRWRRVRRAMDAVARGASLTEAAVEAGFADGAHLSRVWHAQFGMSPNQAVSLVHFRGRLT